MHQHSMEGIFKQKWGNHFLEAIPTAYQCRRKHTVVFATMKTENLTSANLNIGLMDAECMRNYNLQSLRNNSTKSKQQIQKKAETEFNTKFNIICSKSDLTYIVHADKYCKLSELDITCFLFTGDGSDFKRSSVPYFTSKIPMIVSAVPRTDST
ncbi:unnamed protein product [Thelazia callipaeda]|uniref:Ground-like domain-containing protein n=1 Tax=Thelazia callipaeda TaxID=103827 RepID=A0A0N5DC97_THECL|nr:unnamed protein product [Thelazia callipaeda]